MLPLLVALTFQDWSTTYERSNFMETGRYEEAVDYCKRLVKASPNAKLLEYGTSPEGRPMIAVIMSSSGEFSPVAMGLSPKPLVFIQNGIHAGEIEGKDASLILAREILVQKTKADLLKDVNVVLVPIFGVDAHERFGPYNRINQNGPKEMGWRSNAQNLNLNRDYIKADAGEMKAQLRLLHLFKPDFFFDNHTTDGADYQYSLTLGVPWGPTLPEKMAAWQRGFYENVKAKCDSAGVLTAPYFELADRSDPAKGISVEDFGPRYANGYLTAMNRPSVLVETHMLKPYKQRVEATYQVMVEAIRYCASQAKELKQMIREADAADATTQPGHPFVVSSKLTDETEPFTFLGYRYAPVDSPITGAKVAHWEHDPVNTETTVKWNYAPDVTVEAAAGYAVPAPWTDVIDRLLLHGIRFTRLTKPMKATFETYVFKEVSFPKNPFESRFMPSYKVERITEERTLPIGSAIIPIDQAPAKLIVNLLEPEAPDSFARWGFFNTIFERKEYAEDYALEPIARKLLEDDTQLKADFEERLKDPAFAGSPSARLAWLFDRSPWADSRLNKYPVVRLTSLQLSEAK